MPICGCALWVDGCSSMMPDMRGVHTEGPDRRCNTNVVYVHPVFGSHCKQVTQN